MDVFLNRPTADWELKAAKAENARLLKENQRLQEKIELFTSEQRMIVASNIEVKIRAFKLEDERDQLLAELDCLKQKYDPVYECIDAVQNESSSTKLSNLEKALAQAYEMIDKLEFEMETIGLLEIENQRLHSELANLRRKYDEPCQQLDEPKTSYDELDSGFGSQRSTLIRERTTSTASVQLRNEREQTKDFFPQRRLGIHLTSERLSTEPKE